MHTYIHACIHTYICKYLFVTTFQWGLRSNFSHHLFITRLPKSTLNFRFLGKSSWQFYLHPEFLPEFCWKEVAELIFFSYFVSMSDLGFEEANILSTRLRQLPEQNVEIGFFKCFNVVTFLQTILNYLARNEYFLSNIHVVKVFAFFIFSLISLTLV